MADAEGCMSRFARRVDDNQTAVVETLRRLGCSVFSVASVGRGCPDLLVGVGGRTHLVEVKDGSKAPSARRLTPLEEQFARTWRGARVELVECPEDCIELVAKWRAHLVASDVEVDASDWERPVKGNRKLGTNSGAP